MRQLFKKWILWASLFVWSGTFPAAAAQGTFLVPQTTALLENRDSENGRISEENLDEQRNPDEKEPDQNKKAEENQDDSFDNTKNIGQDPSDLPRETRTGSESQKKDQKEPGGIQKMPDPDEAEEDEGKPGPASWLSKDWLLKAAAGFGAGVLVTIVVTAGILSLGRGKKSRKGETDQDRTVTDHSFVPSVSSGDNTSFLSSYNEASEPGGPSLVLPDASNGSVGTVHSIGRRKNQEDTFGVNHIKTGLLAVVSDGMGGLSGSERVSQQAVMGMFQAGNQISPSASENPLYEMLSIANEQVLKMLGPDQIYKSGATLLAILANNGRFHWAAVGDSRIYLYCSHHLIQVNREHIYKRQLIGEAVNKNISFSTVNTDPQKDRLISFLGMGELKYIDGSLRPIEVRQGDKVLLMSDGIFDTISEKEIMDILESTRNAAEAAALMEKQVGAAGNPRQDNFTCVILDF